MAVDSTHKDYDAMLPIQDKCVHAYEGQDAIHAAGATYLPKLKDESDAEYKARKERAMFFNATGRTVEGLVGMVMRKTPTIEADAGFKNLLNDVDMQGTSVNEFADYLLGEVIVTNRIGLLVEYPKGEKGLTKAEVEAKNIRPYITTYNYRSIVNWKVERVNNVMQPVMIVLAEEYQKGGGDKYKSETDIQYRELALEDGKYIQRLYRKNDKGEWIQEGDDIIPEKNSKPLNKIPFVLCGQHKNFKPEAPIIIDLVNVNLAHYRVNADYEHGCHFTGLPTPWITGHRGPEEGGEKETYYIGSTTAWVFSEENAKVGFLEFTGQGLDALKGNLDGKKQEMAVLGARIIEDQKSGVEAFETAQLRANGENSTLANIAKIVSKQLSEALSIMSDWAGNGPASIKLNTDYFPVTMTAQQLTAIVQAWQSGAMSDRTKFENFKRGELIAEDVTFEQEQEEIANRAPALNANS
jgi:hypothetical protein